MIFSFPDGFYLCQSVQHIYNTTAEDSEFRIRWLNPVTSDPDCDEFKIDYVDVTTPECVVTNTKLTRFKGGIYKLSNSERAKIEKKLLKHLQGEESVEEEDEEDEDEGTSYKEIKFIILQPQFINAF